MPVPATPSSATDPSAQAMSSTNGEAQQETTSTSNGVAGVQSPYVAGTSTDAGSNANAPYTPLANDQSTGPSDPVQDPYSGFNPSSTANSYVVPQTGLYPNPVAGMQAEAPQPISPPAILPPYPTGNSGQDTAGGIVSNNTSLGDISPGPTLPIGGTDPNAPAVTNQDTGGGLSFIPTGGGTWNVSPEFSNVSPDDLFAGLAEGAPVLTDFLPPVPTGPDPAEYGAISAAPPGQPDMLPPWYYAQPGYLVENLAAPMVLEPTTNQWTSPQQAAVDQLSSIFDASPPPPPQSSFEAFFDLSLQIINIFGGVYASPLDAPGVNYGTMGYTMQNTETLNALINDQAQQPAGSDVNIVWPPPTLRNFMTQLAPLLYGP